MNLLPYEHIIYKTALSEAEALKCLSEAVEPRKVSFSFNTRAVSKAYEGKIKENQFEISRVIRYRNSFLPQITGKIQSQYDGSMIVVKMKLNPFVIGFMCLWCGGVGFGGVMMLIASIASKELKPALLIPFGMVFVALVMTIGGFKAESGISRKDLKEIFDAEII